MSLFSYLCISVTTTVKARALFTLFYAAYATFSLLGLFCEFRQRCPTQVGRLVVGQSLQLDNGKILLPGDVDLRYRFVAMLRGATLTWVQFEIS